MRWQVHLEPASVRQAADALSGMQEAGAQDHFDFPFTHETETTFGFGRQKGRVLHLQEAGQG
jgi:hypothetical protein